MTNLTNLCIYKFSRSLSLGNRLNKAVFERGVEFLRVCVGLDIHMMIHFARWLLALNVTQEFKNFLLA